MTTTLLKLKQTKHALAESITTAVRIDIIAASLALLIVFAKVAAWNEQTSAPLLKKWNWQQLSQFSNKACQRLSKGFGKSIVHISIDCISGRLLVTLDKHRHNHHHR